VNNLFNQTEKERKSRKNKKNKGWGGGLQHLALI